MSLELQPRAAGETPTNGEAAVGVGYAAPGIDEPRRRERLTWIILLFSGMLFVALAIAAVVGFGWYRDAALSVRTASLDIIGGVVLYQPEDAMRETVATNDLVIQDGDRVHTADGGHALVSLPDGSNIQLWPGTTIQIRQLRSSTYSNDRSVLLIHQLSGHVRVEVASPPTLERRFELQTPHTRALLREGSYRVEVGGFGTELATRSGSASVIGPQSTVEVLRGERTIVASGQNPSAPAGALRNLIFNGDFRRGFDGWRQGSRNEEDGVLGQVSIVDQEGRFVARLRRQGSQKHGEAFIHQTINRDVRDEQTLRVVLDAKVMSQSLSGGGVLGTEYPLLVRVRYRDAYGSENQTVRGFFVRNPDSRPTTNGVQLTANQWLPITIDLFDEKQVAPRPAYLMWIEVEGGGWEFESFATGIQLLAE